MACYGCANEYQAGKPNPAERQSHLHVGAYLALRTRGGRFPMGALPTHLHGSWMAIDHIDYVEFTVHVHLLVHMPGSPD